MARSEAKARRAQAGTGSAGGAKPAALKPADREAGLIDYRALFEHAPDAMFVVGSQGDCIDANHAASTLTGCSRQELSGMRVVDLFVSSENKTTLALLGDALDVGRSEWFATLSHKDGTRRNVECHAVDLGNGTIEMVVRDISEHPAAERELENSADTYGAFVRLCHEAVISADQQGRILSWNSAAQTLLGYTAQEAIGMPVTRLVPSRLQARYRAAVEAHSQAGGREPFIRTLRTEALHKNGREVPIEASVGVARHDDRLVFAAVVREIPEHDAMVEELNDALQRLRFHIERMPLAYIVWDRDFRVEEWNPAAERMFGYSKAEVIGKHPYALIVPPDVQPAVDSVWQDLLEGDTSSHSINDNVRKDGTRMTCEWFSTPLRDSAGDIRGVASMAMDISEREAMSAQLRNAQRLESLGVLASGVAHDFNSSLMVILGNTTLLRSVKGLPPKALEYIEPIEDAGSRANELIKHLLTYARTGRHNPQPTDLNSVIKDAVGFIHASIGKQYELDVRLAKRLPSILADRGQAEQILLNLCLNAKQAMGGHGTIGITTRRANLTQSRVARCVPHDGKPGPHVELVVSDSGCGMDDVTIHRIFDPFFTTKADGQGLGLAAVLGILRQHNAMALVDSKLGKGTKIHIFFPVLKDAGRAEHSPEPRPQSQAARRRTSGTKRS